MLTEIPALNHTRLEKRLVRRLTAVKKPRSRKAIRIPQRVQTSQAISFILLSTIRFPLRGNMGKDMKLLVDGTIFAFFPK